jgi:hypothetical protein
MKYPRYHYNILDAKTKIFDYAATGSILWAYNISDFLERKEKLLKKINEDLTEETVNS